MRRPTYPDDDGPKVRKNRSSAILYETDAQYNIYKKIHWCCELKPFFLCRNCAQEDVPLVHVNIKS